MIDESKTKLYNIIFQTTKNLEESEISLNNFIQKLFLPKIILDINIAKDIICNENKCPEVFP